MPLNCLRDNPGWPAGSRFSGERLRRFDRQITGRATWRPGRRGEGRMLTTTARLALALLRGLGLALIALALGMIALNQLEPVLVRPAAVLLVFGLTPVAFVLGLAGVPGRKRHMLHVGA